MIGIESVRNSIQTLLSRCSSKMELTSDTFFEDYSREINIYVEQIKEYMDNTLKEEEVCRESNIQCQHTLFAGKSKRKLNVYSYHFLQEAVLFYNHLQINTYTTLAIMKQRIYDGRPHIDREAVNVVQEAKTDLHKHYYEDLGHTNDGKNPNQLFKILSTYYKRNENYDDTTSIIIDNSGNVSNERVECNEAIVMCRRIKNMRQLKIIYERCLRLQRNVETNSVSDIQKKMNNIYSEELKKPLTVLQDTYEYYLEEAIQNRARKFGTNNINEYISELRQIIDNIIYLRQFDLNCIATGAIPSYNEHGGRGDHIDYINVIRSLKSKLNTIEQNKFPVTV